MVYFPCRRCQSRFVTDNEIRSYTVTLLPPRERPGTYCKVGWVGRRAGLDRCGKSRPFPHRDAIP